MIERRFWIERVEAAWRKRPVAWLSGVRRTGKTTLARMLPGVEILNCDLPSAVRRLEDPEFFFQSLPEGSRIALDEVHRLPDPSRVLKIAADAFPRLRVLATGSSTLAATKKFRDSLTGRKSPVFLPPVLWTECEEAFRIRDLDRRLLRGGLPEALLAPGREEVFYAEWLDSFYARDVQELFGVRDRTGFLDLLRLLLRQSGGLADVSALSRECGLSRPTVNAYLEALAIAHALHVVPPFHGGGRRELLKRPKVYGFDTGFVAFARGWNDVRDEDRGTLWEHLVLDVLLAADGGEGVRYWRDKSGREVDFVVQKGREVLAIECKVNPDRFDPASLLVFRGLVPEGRDFLVCPGVEKPFDRRVGGRVLRVTGCEDLLRIASGPGPRQA